MTNWSVHRKCSFTSSLDLVDAEHVNPKLQVDVRERGGTYTFQPVPNNMPEDIILGIIWE